MRHESCEEVIFECCEEGRMGLGGWGGACGGVYGDVGVRTAAACIRGVCVWSLRKRRRDVQLSKCSLGASVACKPCLLAML